MVRTAILLLGLSALLPAADTRDVRRTVALDPRGEVVINNHKGSIHVTTWDRSEVDIQATIAAESGAFVDQRRFDRTEIVIDASLNLVRVQTKYPDSQSFWTDGTNPEIRYTIRMPRTAHLSIRDHR